MITFFLMVVSTVHTEAKQGSAFHLSPKCPRKLLFRLHLEDNTTRGDFPQLRGGPSFTRFPPAASFGKKGKKGGGGRSHANPLHCVDSQLIYSLNRPF